MPNQILGGDRFIALRSHGFFPPKNSQENVVWVQLLWTGVAFPDGSLLDPEATLRGLTSELFHRTDLKGKLVVIACVQTIHIGIGDGVGAAQFLDGGKSFCTEVVRIMAEELQTSGLNVVMWMGEEKQDGQPVISGCNGSPTCPTNQILKA